MIPSRPSSIPLAKQMVCPSLHYFAFQIFNVSLTIYRFDKTLSDQPEFMKAILSTQCDFSVCQRLLDVDFDTSTNNNLHKSKFLHVYVC